MNADQLEETSMKVNSRYLIQLRILSLSDIVFNPYPRQKHNIKNLGNLVFCLFNEREDILWLINIVLLLILNVL